MRRTCSRGSGGRPAPGLREAGREAEGVVEREMEKKEGGAAAAGATDSDGFVVLHEQKDIAVGGRELSTLTINGGSLISRIPDRTLDTWLLRLTRRADIVLLTKTHIPTQFVNTSTHTGKNYSHREWLRQKAGLGSFRAARPCSGCSDRCNDPRDRKANDRDVGDSRCERMEVVAAAGFECYVAVMREENGLQNAYVTDAIAWSRLLCLALFKAEEDQERAPQEEEEEEQRYREERQGEEREEDFGGSTNGKLIDFEKIGASL
uniref:Uncharacterized protein n=1 Tax=Chromera velia CCMP2878 TaxID=1169474 RepID=A0A0G4FPF7_9ALVE|eukprot:Cvel_18093.t1-p1 / transcript=Cvel_18093.t1 / gene=Cvel_18093 / organism=Chromera_velia_CCMP2878 / gene_product=hypothetical protein / transcript_product=hypothetical protein / location=Cvel_scaffold1482:40650-43842(-) / protein_length=262 / sequence_SO=supercontig / SO=protein_coding / is_pseudo=false